MKEMDMKSFEQACYEAYQLDWMISHGYSLKDYLYGIAEAEEEARLAENYPEGGTLDVYDSLEADFEDQGFNGSLYVCKDEFLGAEFRDPDYMEHLISMMPNSKAMEEFWRTTYRVHKEEKPGVEVYTSAGVLKAYPNQDPDQPGICVCLQPAGYEEEIDAAFVSVYENPEFATSEGERPEDVAIMSYGDATTEDYTVKEIIRREDVIAGLGTGSKS